MHWLILFAALSLAPGPSVSLRWNPVTTLANGKPLVGPVYYNVYRDVAGTLQYSKLNPSPLLCPEYYDNTTLRGVVYDYEVTAWTPAGGESGFSAKSGNVHP